MENEKVSPVTKDDDQKNGATKNENINSANDVTANKNVKPTRYMTEGENIKPAGGITEKEMIEVEAVADLMNMIAKEGVMREFIHYGPHMAQTLSKIRKKKAEETKAAEEKETKEKMKAAEKKDNDKEEAEEDKQALDEHERKKKFEKTKKSVELNHSEIVKKINDLELLEDTNQLKNEVAGQSTEGQHPVTTYIITTQP